MKKDLVIVGAGGFGREVLWQWRENKKEQEEYNLKGFIDDYDKILGKEISGLSVIGTTDDLLKEEREVSVLLAFGSARARRNAAEKLKQNKNLVFPNFISDRAILSNNVVLGEGCIICMSSIITVDIKIGDFFLSNLDCTIGHDCIIEDFVTLYPSVNVSGNVRIGTGTEIGTGTQIIQGKTIGKECIVGAGAVVNRDIPDYATAVGVPAKVIKYSR